MQEKLPLDLNQDLDQLRALIAAKLTSQSDIAMKTGIDQSQISRILAGQVKRASKNVRELCKFAKTFDSMAENDPSRSAVLMSAMRAVWDGSNAHAEAIASVVLCLRKFKES